MEYGSIVYGNVLKTHLIFFFNSQQNQCIHLWLCILNSTLDPCFRITEAKLPHFCCMFNHYQLKHFFTRKNNTTLLTISQTEFFPINYFFIIILKQLIYFYKKKKKKKFMLKLLLKTYHSLFTLFLFFFFITLLKGRSTLYSRTIIDSIFLDLVKL